MANQNKDPVVTLGGPTGQQNIVQDQVIVTQQQPPAQNPVVNRLQVKVPPFWKKNPALWFKQLEAQFSNSGITEDLTRFNTIVGVIESDVLDFVSDIVLAPPATHRYQTIKERLIKQFTESDSKKLHSLLHELQIGDMKPSNLLRQMKELSCGKVGDDLLKTLWLQKLPTTIQTILSTNAQPLELLTPLADTMFETHEGSTVQTVSLSPTNQFNDLVNAVYKLDDKIEALKKHVRASSKSSKSASRSRSPSPKQAAIAKGKICFYHQRFGNKAKKCATPCKFHKSQTPKN